MKLTDKEKERLRSSTAGNFLSDMDLDLTNKQQQDDEISLPTSEDQVEDDDDDYIHEDDGGMHGRASFEKTEFSFKYSDEKPVIEFGKSIKARFIDSDRYLRFYLRKKCNDDDKCYKYSGRGTKVIKGEHFEWNIEEIDLENIEWEYEHWSDGM